MDLVQEQLSEGIVLQQSNQNQQKLISELLQQNQQQSDNQQQQQQDLNNGANQSQILQQQTQNLQQNINPQQVVQATTEQDQKPRIKIYEQAQNQNLWPWMFAIEKGYQDINALDDKGQHLLHRAIAQGVVEIVVCLIEKFKVEIDLRTRENKQTGLMFAASYGNVQLIKYLLDKGADINAKDANSYCALLYAVTQRNKTAALYLIGKGSNIETIDSQGCNIAHWAAYNNDVFMLEIINQLQQDLLFENDKANLTPFTRAITNDSYLSMKYILQLKPQKCIQGSNINFSKIENKLTRKILSDQYYRQNASLLSLSYYVDLYKSKPKDMCVVMYCGFICVLYYTFVQQIGFLYSTNEALYNFCNYMHFMVVGLITYVFYFVYKSECPSIQYKLSMQTTNNNYIRDKNVDLKKADLKFLDKIFVGDQVNVNCGDYSNVELKEAQKRKRLGLNVLDLILILVENDRYKDAYLLNERNICTQCLHVKQNRTQHSNKLGICIPAFSHYSEIFDKCIIKDVNHKFYYLILCLQQFLLIVYFVVNFYYCDSKYSYSASPFYSIFEIPYIYWKNGACYYFASYLFYWVLLYLSTLFFVMETFCICTNLTRFELLNPEQCDYFYSIQNINSVSANPHARDATITYFRGYNNNYNQNCMKSIREYFSF